MGLTSTAYLKTILGVSNNSEDAKLDALRAAAETMIKNYLSRDIEVASYAPGATSTPAQFGEGDSGYYNGDNSEYLILRQTPVSTLSSVYLDTGGRFGDNPDGAFASDTILVAGTDYVLQRDGLLPGTGTRCSYSGIVRKLNGLWPGAWRYSSGSVNPDEVNHFGNIKVTYTAGYPVVPADLQYAVALIVGKMRRTASYGGMPVQSEHYEDYSYSLARTMSHEGSLVHQIGEVAQILAKYKRIWI